MSTTFSPARRQLARLPARRGRRRSWTRTSPCGARSSSSRRRCSSDDRDERDDAATTLHAVAVVDGAVIGAVRLYPLARRALEGRPARGAAGARVRRLGALLVDFAVATAGERGGDAMVAQVQVPNVRFFERLGWAADGAAGALPRRHAPADGDPAASPVSGVLARSHTARVAPPAASRRTRVASKLPHGGAGEPAAGERLARSSACSGVAASRKPKLGKASSQRSSGAPAGRGSASRSSVAPQPAPSIICSSEPATPGIETSRAACASPLSAISTSASPSVAQLRPARGRGARSRTARVSLIQRPSSANAATSVVARLGRRGPQRALGEARAGRRQRRRVAERQVPADDRHAELLRRPRDPVEHGLGVRLVRADEHVDDRQRAAAHRAHVGDVRDHRGRAGAERIGATNGGDIASPHTTRNPSPCGTSAASSPSIAEPLDELHVALAEQSRRRTDQRRRALRGRPSPAIEA